MNAKPFNLEPPSSESLQRLSIKIAAGALRAVSTVRARKTQLSLTLMLVLAMGLSGCGGTASSNTNMTTSPPPTTPDARADAMIAQMTQAQELQLVQGGVTTDLTYGYTVPQGAAGYVPGIPAVGIPELYLADGSVGVGNGVGPATALPSSIASAASWDTAEATKYGTVIGTELSDYGINVNLGGNTNLIGREPRDGRTFETKGEDPILCFRSNRSHPCGERAKPTALTCTADAYQGYARGCLPAFTGL